MNKKTIRDVDVSNRRVLVRVDFNVPMDKEGRITDDTRIQASLPTINYLREQGAAIILMAHLGRPKGTVNLEFTLSPVARHLAKLLSCEVQFAVDCIGEDARAKAAALKAGEILLLENLRFHKEEEKNDPVFAAKLAELADIYVNDGFGVSHRAHASVEGVTHYLPSVAGFLLEKEIAFVGNAVENPMLPFAAIIGGAKVSDKIAVIENLLNKVDVLIIGGGMANTFLAAQGYKLGKSLIEEDKIELAHKLIETAAEKGVKLYLPVDMVIADKFAADARHKVVAAGDIDEAWMALDIGPKTQQLFTNALTGMKTVVWNGPMGVFEFDAFAAGTKAVAKAVAECGAVSIVGGGDSIAALEKTGLSNKISHISTGGGASLEYLEGKVLPGIAALDDFRTPIIAGNWKMHLKISEAVNLVEELKNLVSDVKKREIVVCPVFTSLYAVGKVLDNSNIKLGAQDVYYEEQGAYTGEVAPSMLTDVGCNYVIIGHSERRTYFGETDETVNKKLHAAFKAKLIPILCVGETLEQREKETMYDVIKTQLVNGLKGISAQQAAEMIIAYEPVWAIGTGKNATSDDANEMCRFIRNIISEIYSTEIARAIRIQYGGSVKPENIAAFMAKSDIDGALVGGASLKAEGFSKIVKF